MRLSKEQNKIINEYLIDSIQPENYDNMAQTTKEKLQFLNDTFISEYNCNIERVGYSRAFTEYIQGLPSCISIVFYNYDILELAKVWGSIPQNPTEKQEEKILDNWFNFVSNRLIVLMNRNKVSTNKIGV